MTTPYGLRNLTPLPAPATALTYNPATQVTTQQGGAPISAELLKSWGEQGDDDGTRHARQTGLAAAWGM